MANKNARLACALLSMGKAYEPMHVSCELSGTDTAQFECNLSGFAVLRKAGLCND
jgi:hypothetical protein